MSEKRPAIFHMTDDGKLEAIPTKDYSGMTMREAMDELVTTFSSADFPRAAGCLLRKDGKVLSVSRLDDAGDIGLPGGKVDPEDADDMAAARRELKEETGLVAGEMKFLYGGLCPGGKDGKSYWFTVFIVEDWTGEIVQNETGVIEWVEPEKLLGGSFDAYNRRMLSTLGVL